MTLKWKFFLLACLMAWFGRDGLRAQQPDCSLQINIPTGSSLPFNVGPFDNRTAGCTGWTITYNSTGFSALSIVVQTAPNNGGVPGAWSTFTAVTGVNPNTATTENVSTFGGITSYFPWLRVQLTSATGSGTISGRLYGNRTPGSSTSGKCPGGSDTQVQFNDSGNCGGASQLLYVKATNETNIGPGDASLSPFIQNYTGPGQANLTSVLSAPKGNGLAIEADATGFGGNAWGEYAVLLGNGNAFAIEGDAYTSSNAGHATGLFGFAGTSNNSTVTALIGIEAYAETDTTAASTDVMGAQFQAKNGGSGTATNLTGMEIESAANTGGGAVTNNYGVNIQNQTVGSNNWAIKTGSGLVELGDNLQLDGKAFASLGTPSNGTQQYCSDCTVTSSIDNTCAASGTGAQAFRLNGAWKCTL